MNLLLEPYQLRGYKVLSKRLGLGALKESSWRVQNGMGSSSGRHNVLSLTQDNLNIRLILCKCVVRNNQDSLFGEYMSKQISYHNSTTVDQNVKFLPRLKNILLLHVLSLYVSLFSHSSAEEGKFYWAHLKSQFNT